MDGLLQVLRTSLSISVPPFLYGLVERVFSHSVVAWEAAEDDNVEEDGMWGGGGGGGGV